MTTNDATPREARLSDGLRKVFVEGATRWADPEDDYSLTDFWHDVEYNALLADRAVPEPDADAADVFDAADSDSWPPPEMKDAPLIRYVHKVMKYHQPTITPEECWVAIGAFYIWMSQNPDRASEMIQAAVPTVQAAAGDDLDIDRLLAERDLDAMLDSVHPKCYIDTMRLWEDGTSYVQLCGLVKSPYFAVGFGPTRMAAILNAIAAAKQEGAG